MPTADESDVAWLPGDPVRLETERFIVRSMIPDDVTERYQAWFTNPEITRTLNTAPRDRSLKELRDFVSQFRNQRRFLLGIFCRETDLLVGRYLVRCDVWNKSGSTDVIIGETDYWGRKVVVETRAALLDFMFGPRKLEKVTGITFARNFAAVYNYKALGFQCEGVLRQHRRNVHDDSRLDQYMFGLLREEWLAQRAAK